MPAPHREAAHCAWLQAGCLALVLPVAPEELKLRIAVVPAWRFPQRDSDCARVEAQVAGGAALPVAPAEHCADVPVRAAARSGSRLVKKGCRASVQGAVAASGAGDQELARAARNATGPADVQELRVSVLLILGAGEVAGFHASEMKEGRGGVVQNRPRHARKAPAHPTSGNPNRSCSLFSVHSVLRFL